MERILARGVTVSGDTRATGLNNNDIIIDPSGAGKTRGYGIPNILQAGESMVVTDTKGKLRRLPVRFIMDDFAAGTRIPDFDNTTLNDAWLFARGQRPRQVRKYTPEDHFSLFFARKTMPFTISRPFAPPVRYFRGLL